jgi:hypothetical protein
VRRGLASFFVAMALSASVAHAQITPALEAARDAMEAGEADRARAMFTALTRSASLREAATAVYYLAVMADEGLEFRRALAGYQDFIARDPGSRFAARAQARVDDLLHHAEGNFAPLVALERVRRNEQSANSLAGIQRLDREMATFPAGAVRAEAQLLVGEAYLNRLQRPRDAARVLHILAGDTSAAQEVRSLAAERLVQARTLMGEERVAAQEITALRVDPEVQRDAEVLARRSLLRDIAWATLAVTAAAGVTSLVRAARAKRMHEVLRVWKRPLPLAQIAVLTLGGGALAKAYDEHEVSPFLLLGAGALAVYLAATAWNVVGSNRVALRVGRALVCMLAALAVSFLTMHTLDTMMLEGINL